MQKIRIYVYSIGRIPTQDFVDKEGAMHACARAGNLPFEAIGRYPGDMDGHLLSVEEKNAILLVESFCKQNGYQFEIVDFAELSFISKLKLKRKGVKNFPTVSCGEKFFCGNPTVENLVELTKVNKT